MPDEPGSARREIRVGVRELRGKLTHYLREARAGTSVLVTSRQDVIAEIRAPTPPVRHVRRPGALRGQIHMAPDFDALPDDLMAAMEG